MLAAGPALPYDPAVTGRPAVVIFDLDGTLLDHEASVIAALRAWLPSLGVRQTDDLAAVYLDRCDLGPHAEPARLASLRGLAGCIRSSSGG